MTPIAAVLGAGLRRRRVQGAAVGIVVSMSVAAATLSLTILVGSTAPYERAFAAASGAHLVVDVDGAAVTPEQLAATASLPGVAAAAGPWDIGLAGLVDGSVAPGAARPPGPAGGRFAFPLRVSDRDAADGPVDRLTLDGRWARGDGEIVISQRLARLQGLAIGDRVTITIAPRGIKGAEAGPSSAASAAPGTARGATTVERAVVVVGTAGSISAPDIDAWLGRTDFSAVTIGGPTRLEMLYRVDGAATAADLERVRATIAAHLPAGAIVSLDTWLDARAAVDKTADLMVPILAAFSVFALAAAAFMVVNVIGGIVLGGRRQIGLLLSVGVTPRQVVAILLGQVALPALAGDALGLVVGTIASRPMLEDTIRAFGLPGGGELEPGVLAVTGIVAMAVVVGAALLPAWGAAHGSPTDALAGRATATSTRRRRGPASGGGRSLPTGRWPALATAAADALRPSVWIGLRRSSGHPLRTAMTTGAIAVGVAAIVFSAGTYASLRAIAPALLRDHAAPIRTGLVASSQVAGIETALAADPDLGRVTSVTAVDVTVPAAGKATYFAYGGDASWVGYAMVSGRWFDGPGEVVASSHLLEVAGLSVGDHLTIGRGAATVDVVVVGEVFDVESDAPDNLLVRGDAGTIAPLGADPGPARFEAEPARGVTAEAAIAGLRGRLGVPVVLASNSDADEHFLLFEGVVVVLGLVLVLVAVGGVFHTVLLDTRQRALETAILKALGLTPRQTVGVILWSVVPIGLVGGLIGIPAGSLLTRLVLSDMGRIAGPTLVPEGFLDVLGPLAIVLGLSGIAIAVAGSWIPAGAAARSRIAAALHAE
jgi:putative ABC transport system permease protein